MSDLARCKTAWLKTLEHFGISRGLMGTEETEIARAIQKHGAESVELALYGAAFEPKTDKFDPQDHVSIARVLRPNARGETRIDKYVNWGSKQRMKEKRKTENWRDVARTVDVIEEWHEQDPERVREIIRGITKEMPR